MAEKGLSGHYVKIGGFLRELYAVQGVPAVYETICGGLGALVNGDNIFIDEQDMEHTQITGYVARKMCETAGSITTVNSCAGKHPRWKPIRTGGQVVRSISYHGSSRHREKTTWFCEALGKEGVRDHLSIEFGGRHQRIVSVWVFRKARGFSKRDHETMAFLTPHIELALGNARLMENAGLVTSIRSNNGERAMVALNSDGKPLHLHSAISDLLGRVFKDHAFCGNRFPQEVESWIVFTKALLDQRVLENLPKPLTVKGAGITLEFRLLRQHSSGGYGMLICSKSEIPSQHLTRREVDVLQWLREGKRNDEIAIILGMGVTTVKSHLKHIYEKIGVENRTAAARFFDNTQNLEREPDSKPD